MASLSEDDLYTNVLHCKYCGSYNYFDKGIYNRNIFFGLVGSKTSTYDGLKEVLIEKLTEGGSNTPKREIKHIRIERFLLPVREFVSDGQHTYVSMLETDADEIEKNIDLRDLLEDNLRNIENLFSMNTIRPLRLGHLQDVTDTKGHTYKTHVLPTSRSKQSIDASYNINPLDMLHILYIPIYRLSFKDNGPTFVCMGDDNLTGLTIGSDFVGTSRVRMSNQKRSNKESWRLALTISCWIAGLITAVNLVFVIKSWLGSGSNLFSSLIGNIIIWMIVLTAVLLVPTHIFLSSFTNTILAFRKSRERQLRKLLASRFGYKAQIQ